MPDTYADPVWTKTPCALQHALAYVCTLEKGHRGRHVAHQSSGGVAFRWESLPDLTDPPAVEAWLADA